MLSCKIPCNCSVHTESWKGLKYRLQPLSMRLSHLHELRTSLTSFLVPFTLQDFFVSCPHTGENLQLERAGMLLWGSVKLRGFCDVFFPHTSRGFRGDLRFLSFFCDKSLTAYCSVFFHLVFGSRMTDVRIWRGSHKHWSPIGHSFCPGASQ